MFKVGDKIKIINTDGISASDYSNGEVVTIDQIGDTTGILYIGYRTCINTDEFHCIELVEEQPEKSAVTISITLPSQVLTLTKADYEELKRILSE